LRLSSAEAQIEGSGPRVGVLASQGGFHAHLEALRAAGAEAIEVRRADQFGDLDGLVLPGGESTTLAMAIESDGLADAIREHHRSGRPVLATCAGMILAGSDRLGLGEYTTKRNAFGRQLASFETDLEIAGLEGGPFRAVFIRAPWIESVGEGVEVLASYEGHPVAVRQANLTAFSFHPELTDDTRLHAAFVLSCT
jgi:5'-phosphate synthase pdxT subunit